jgi:hypothetical protein
VQTTVVFSELLDKAPLLIVAEPNSPWASVLAPSARRVAQLVEPDAKVMVLAEAEIGLSVISKA